MSSLTLYYVHDPMCAWCYGIQRSLKTLLLHLPDNVKLEKLLGGLAPDTNEPMPIQMRDYIKANWQRIEQTIPGVSFNYDFWDKCTPKRSTYPACRAVISARIQDENAEDKMTTAIQKAYYQEAKNPSDIDTLVQISEDIGLSTAQFKEDLLSDTVDKILISEIQQSRTIGVNSYPSFVLESDGGFAAIPLDYNDPYNMLEIINAIAQS